MGMLNDNDIATTGQKITIQSKSDKPEYHMANDLLRQISKMKAERTACLKQADQYRERIDTLEAQFHKIVLELEPTEICTTGKPKREDETKKLLKALSSKLVDSPSLEEQLNKILESMNNK